MSFSTPLSVEFLSDVLEHLAHPVFVKDRDFRFVIVNPALAEMVGYPRDQMLGKTDYDFFPKEQADRFREKDRELFATGATIHVDEETITDAAGKIHILATTKVPRRDRHGDVTHIVGIVSDITRLKRTEEELRKSKEELEQRVDERSRALAAAQQELLRKERLAVLGQLAGGLAHQLRNPLAAIQNAVALVRKAGITEMQTQALDIIAEEVARADRTITHLLEYARVRQPDARELVLRHLLDEVLDLERPPIGVLVEIAGDESVRVVADPLQLQSALGNVVRNAYEAMPDGGDLHIRIEQRGDRARIELRDTGEGVAEEARGNLFDPLVTTKPLGVGLGLSTARALIENQTGTIAYQPIADGGSLFVIELPSARSGD